MKRILLSVFAVAITAAWAVPASAGDVTFGGQYRARGEYTENADYNDDLGDATTMWAQRVRLTANANATDDTSVKITLQDTRTWGGTSLLSDSANNQLDLHEAYVNIKNIFGAPVDFRAGRQELAYGSQRQIGSFGWSNNGRAFDGFKVMYGNDGVNLDAFYMTVAEGGNDDTSLAGVYGTFSQLLPNNTVDAYVLNRRDNATMSLYTIGARVKGAFQAFDYTGEIAFQTGEASATADYDAYAYAITAGYTLPTPMKIRIGAEYDFATGQDTSTDTTAYTQLYPTNHGHFGIGDVVNTWSNISAWSINASAQVNDRVNLYAAYWDYKQDEATVAAAGDDLGSELDFVAKYKYNNNVGIEAGYAHFMPDTATSGAGNPDDARGWAYLQLTANF